MSSITLNIIPFDHPQESITFGFSLNKSRHNFPLRREDFNDSIKSHFDKTLPNIQTIYGEPIYGDTDYELITTINANDEPGIIKHYYRHLIRKHFLDHGHTVGGSFVGDPMIYIQQPSDDLPYNVFKTYTIKILLSRIFEGPHFAISYNGIKSFAKTPLSELTHLGFDDISTLLYDRRLYKYNETTPDFIMHHQDEAFPKLSRRLKAELGIVIDPRKIKNKYTHFYSEINSFIKDHLDTDEFKEVFPLKSGKLLAAPKVGLLSSHLSQLAYGQNKGVDPKREFKKYKAASPAPRKSRKLLFIYNPKDKFVITSDDGKKVIEEGIVNKFFHAIKNGCETTLGRGYVYTIPPLNQYISSNFQLTSEGTEGIEIHSDESTISDIQKALDTLRDLETTEYVALVLLPHTKEEKTPEQAKLYANIKELLLSHGITSQVLLKDTIANEEFIWSYSTAAISLLAKIGGMPWKLAHPIKDELIVGLGAFSSQETNCRFVGSAFSFGSDGKFEGLNCFRSDDIAILLTSVHEAIRKYKNRLSKDAKRLVIHFYKEMKRDDFEKVMKVINSHEWDIPIITININTSASEDFIGFDTSVDDLMPTSGTYISLDNNTYLLYNNTRHTAGAKPSEGYHLPIKLSFSSSHPETLDDPETIQELISQVFQFSRLYWKSTKHQSIPVTISFPEMAARIYAKFDNPDLGVFGETNLWFL